MRNRPRTPALTTLADSSIAMTLIAVLALGIAGCDSKPKPRPVPRGALFSFDYKKVRSVEIVQNDPELSEQWSARLENPVPGDVGAWIIASAPGGQTLLDRLAAGNLIQHLLDTLNTLRATDASPQVSTENLGLTPPQILLRWSDTQDQLKELRLGRRVSTQTEDRYAQLGPAPLSQPFIVQGSTLKMLGYASRFASIRRSTLLDFDLDDADEVEIGKLLLHRQGTDWADPKGKLYPPKKQIELRTFLDALFHLKIMAFVDDPDANAALLAHFPKKVTHRAGFKGRGLPSPATLEIAQVRGNGATRVYAMISSRPHVVFELFPETDRILRQWPSR